MHRDARIEQLRVDVKRLMEDDADPHIRLTLTNRHGEELWGDDVVPVAMNASRDQFSLELRSRDVGSLAALITTTPPVDAEREVLKALRTLRDFVKR